MAQPAFEASPPVESGEPFFGAEAGIADADPTLPLRSVGPDDRIVDVLLADMDDALQGLDYTAIRNGFCETLSGEEERIAARALATHRNLTGGKRIL